MAFEAKVGSFNVDTSKVATETQAITGIGFQPKVVMFWWGGSTATSDNVSGGTIYSCGFGAAISSSSRFCVHSFHEDGADTSGVYVRQTDIEVICAVDGAGGGSDGKMDFQSMDAGGFTLVVDEQFTYAFRVSYLALGGSDLTDVYIGNQATPTSLGNYDVTSVGFEPDAIIFSGWCGTAAQSTGGQGCPFVGMATGSSNQGVVSQYSQNGQETTDAGAYGYNGEDVVYQGYGSTLMREAFVQFLSNGFRQNHLEYTIARYYYYIALKGGQYAVGELDTRTDGNDIEENVGFQPVAVLFASANRAHSTQDTNTPHARMSIGAGTSASERACAAWSDEDGLDVSETAFANYDSAVYAHVADDAIQGLMDIKSIDSDGFTCVMDDTDPSACWVTYLAIGPTADALGTLATGGAVVETSGGVKYGVFVDDSGDLVVWKNMDSSPSLVDTDTAATIFGGGVIGWVHAAIDSADDIHIVCACTSEQTRDVAYAVFDCGTDTIGAWEEAAGYTEQAPTNARCHITLKSDNEPWVLYADNVKVGGAATDQVYATYKDVTWQTPEQVNGTAAKNVNYDAGFITACPADDLEAFYYHRTNGDPAHRRRNTGWGSETTYTETAATVGPVLCTSGDTPYRYHEAGQNIEENDVDTAYDTDPTYTLVSAALSPVDGVTRYVFYIDANDDVHLISNDGSGWVDEGAVQAGTYLHVIAEWAYNNEHQTGEISYLFDDATTIYYGSFPIAVRVPRPAAVGQDPGFY